MTITSGPATGPTSGTGFTASDASQSMGSASSPTALDIANGPRAEMVARHRFGIEGLDSRIFELDDEQLDRAFLSDVVTASGVPVGKWPVRVLLGHLADAEILFAHRIRRTLAEDRPVLALWDEMAFVDSGIYGPEHSAPIAGFVATVHTLRRWQSELLMPLTEAHWKRTAMHPEQGELSLSWIVAYSTWHLEHHARYLRAKVEHMLGPRPVEAAEGAQASGCCGGGSGAGGCGCEKPSGGEGCGPGCGCTSG